MVHTLPKSSHVTKDTMAKLLIDFLENRAKRHLRSTADLDINFHLYQGQGKSKETIYIETLNSETFNDAVFNNTDVIFTNYLYSNILILVIFFLLLERCSILLHSILCLLSSCCTCTIKSCSFNAKCQGSQIFPFQC